jgi:hypothetical protein
MKIAITATALLFSVIPSSAGCYNVPGDPKTNDDCVLRDLARARQQQQILKMQSDAIERRQREFDQVFRPNLGQTERSRYRTTSDDDE